MNMGCNGKCKNADMLDINEQNIELEDKVTRLQKQVAELIRQLREYEEQKKDDMK